MRRGTQWPELITKPVEPRVADHANAAAPHKAISSSDFFPECPLIIAIFSLDP